MTYGLTCLVNIFILLQGTTVLQKNRYLVNGLRESDITIKPITNIGRIIFRSSLVIRVVDEPRNDKNGSILWVGRHRVKFCPSLYLLRFSRKDLDKIPVTTCTGLRVHTRK